ncbi:phosphonate metabolism protein PhnP [Grimontia hollisae]|uniref:Carbon-phosphorus lyase complex accessory protein n=1 Tax=Grimontia hollisae TaxID=673 RepID=A0A377J731_GRIHO|nr:phosphonate metabolism protein PhnP [Grimontia hollisae]MDF2185040.1 phosphonate metabolism protein PhnP [Grimontia hollisae]STO98188.1 carbon-phosphorus lyase complex accessory protein [Grimontia hollisae]
MLRVTLLGTGAAGGVPLYGCECAACQRARKHTAFERKPCSAMVEWGNCSDRERLLIDAGLMDLHKRFPAGSYYGFLLTHFHVDHVQGLFHLRWGNPSPIPVWCPDDELGCADLLKHPGCLQFLPEMNHGDVVNINGLRVTPLQLKHSRPTVGYLLEYGQKSIAYLTDTDGLPAQTCDFLTSQPQLDALIMDCSFPPDHEGSNHGNIESAYQIYENLQPKALIITHIGHELDCWLMENNVQTGVLAGYDDMKI